MNSNQEEYFFIGVMDLNEAKTHQIKLNSLSLEVEFRTHPSTCTTGCKVTVEVWGKIDQQNKIFSYFQEQHLKNLKGHVPDFNQIVQVFDPQKSSVICQACGHEFSTELKTCPDCGLVYFS
jgi:hypothetical protein